MVAVWTLSEWAADHALPDGAASSNPVRSAAAAPEWSPANPAGSKYGDGSDSPLTEPSPAEEERERDLSSLSAEVVPS
jgi:hypothetical protein